MPRPIQFTLAAIRDLEDIRAWYSQPGAGARARGKVQRILNVIAALAETPEVWQEIGGGIQEAIVADHVIHYRASYSGPRRREPVEVLILRIYRPGMNPPPKWL